jgi:hypothetical protein
MGRVYFAHSLGTLFLIAVTGIVGYVLRVQLALALLALSRLPALRPVWKVQTQIPKPLRVFCGIAAPSVLAYTLTPYLSRVFQGYGYPIYLVTVTIGTIVAFFFFAKPPREFAK